MNTRHSLYGVMLGIFSFVLTWWSALPTFAERVDSGVPGMVFEALFTNSLRLSKNAKP
jgi:hypothetical protein